MTGRGLRIDEAGRLLAVAGEMHKRPRHRENRNLVTQCGTVQFVESGIRRAPAKADENAPRGVENATGIRATRSRGREPSSPSCCAIPPGAPSESATRLAEENPCGTHSRDCRSSKAPCAMICRVIALRQTAAHIDMQLVIVLGRLAPGRLTEAFDRGLGVAVANQPARASISSKPATMASWKMS